MAFDPTDPSSMATPSWEPPPDEAGGKLRNTFGLAIAVAFIWIANAFFEFFVVYLMRRRTDAWRTVVDEGTSTLNVSFARLADDQFVTVFKFGWYLVFAMFGVGALWIHGAATNAMRRGAPNVNPGAIAVRFAIPIIGIPFALREMIRIMLALRRSGRLLAQWLNSMFAYFFVWLGSFALDLLMARRPQTDEAILDRLQLQVTLTSVRALAIAIITLLAVRAILHTDRVLRTAPPLASAPVDSRAD